MKVIFKDNMWIDGETYSADKIYKLPDWLAKIYITEGIAETPKSPRVFSKPTKQGAKSRS